MTEEKQKLSTVKEKQKKEIEAVVNIYTSFNNTHYFFFIFQFLFFLLHFNV